MPDAVVACTAVRDGTGAISDFRWDVVNGAAARLIDAPREALRGDTMLGRLPGHRELGLFDRYVEVVEGSPGVDPPRSAGHVTLDVIDTDTGIPDDVRAQLFDPFFSTKDDGSGLGLASAYGFVTQSGGTIEIDSAQGRGTTVRVVLPAYDPPEAIRGARDTDGATGVVPTRGEVELLVADNHEDVRASGGIDAGRHVLCKPFRPDELLRAIEALVGSGPAEDAAPT